MQMLDTNMILRYLLNDNKEMADKAEKIIKDGSVLVTIEVIAEVVYVLKGVYSIECGQIAKGYEIRTFDKKLQRLLGGIN